MFGGQVHASFERSCGVRERWWLLLLSLAVGTVCLNLAVLPKTTALMEQILVGSLWFPVGEGEFAGALDAAKHGLIFYSVTSGFRVCALVVLSAVVSRAVLSQGGIEADMRICGIAAVIFASLLFVKEALGALCISLTPVGNATIDNLQLKAGLSLLLNTSASGPAAEYIFEKGDVFGIGSVLLSSAWLRKNLDLTWPSAVAAMLMPALAATSAGLALHLALSARMGYLSAASW